MSNKKKDQENNEDMDIEEIMEEEEYEDGVMGEYDVEKILDKKKVGGQWKYLIKWEGWNNPEDLTWEPLEHLDNVPHIVQKFEEEWALKQKNKQDILNEQIKKAREDKLRRERENRQKYGMNAKKNTFELADEDKLLSQTELDKKYKPG
jgi:chromobox protein 1